VRGTLRAPHFHSSNAIFGVAEKMEAALKREDLSKAPAKKLRLRLLAVRGVICERCNANRVALRM
jgi:hypothetical protein